MGERMRRFLARLLSGCWKTHEHLVYSRDADHRLVRYCTACRLQYPILSSPIVRGPRAEPEPVLGQPKFTIVRSARKPSNVIGGRFQ